MANQNLLTLEGKCSILKKERPHRKTAPEETGNSRNRRQLTITITIIFREIWKGNTFIKQEKDVMNKRKREKRYPQKLMYVYKKKENILQKCESLTVGKREIKILET